MHIGIIGGIGPGATDYYYQGLIRALAADGRKLTLTMVHADGPTLLANMAAGDRLAQATVFAGLIERLKAAGAEVAAVTSIAGHFCMGELAGISPLPLCDILSTVNDAVRARGYRRLGLIGTRGAMETRLFGGIDAAEIVVPDDAGQGRVHDAYIAMAMSGLSATAEQRAVLLAAGKELCAAQGAEAVMLGGTDMFLAFDDIDAPGFEIVDCARIHVEALAQLAREDG